MIWFKYASDYGFAASPKYRNLPGYKDEGEDIRKGIKENWLYTGNYEWTISQLSSYAYLVFFVSATGCVRNELAPVAHVVRPVFNLVSSVTYASGTGTKSNPIRIQI